MGSVGNNDNFGGMLNKIKDTQYLDDFIKENIKNPEFKAWGRDNFDSIDDLWREKRTQEELKNIHEISVEEAISIIVDNTSGQTRSLWFREADSDAKPRLMTQILQNPGTLNAGLNIAYSNYKNEMKLKNETPLDFKKWLVTPIELYRGTRGQKTVASDVFSSYTADKKVAAGFTLSDSGGGHALVKNDYSNVDMTKLSTIKIRPIDTWGSYQTTGEQEYLIPSYKLKKK